MIAPASVITILLSVTGADPVYIHVKFWRHMSYSSNSTNSMEHIWRVLQSQSQKSGTDSGWLTDTVW